MKIATYIKTICAADPNNLTRYARQVLLRLEGEPDRYVVVSVTRTIKLVTHQFPDKLYTADMGEAEVLFFRSDEEGNILSYEALPESQYGTFDIPACVAEAGYDLVGWCEDNAPARTAPL